VDDAPVLPPAHAPRAVFVDGRFQPDLSTLGDLPFEATSLAEALPRLEGGSACWPGRRSSRWWR
jgi:hypothetical protein